jgi:hypothetical protein
MNKEKIEDLTKIVKFVVETQNKAFQYKFAGVSYYICRQVELFIMIKEFQEKWRSKEMYEDIKIKKTNGDGGFIIDVGCKTFVAKTEKELFKGLSEYWADPEKAEKKYVKIKDKREFGVNFHTGNSPPASYVINNT